MGDTSWKERVETERAELLARCLKLEAFLIKPDVIDLVGDVQYGLMQDQLHAMYKYYNILEDRLHASSK